MIDSVAIVGRGALGLLFGSIIERNLGEGAVRFVMDDERFARHADETPLINGEPCTVPTIPVSEAEPVDLVILAIKATGLAQALDTMEALVGPGTRIVSVVNGIRSERAIAERFGWAGTALAVAQGMDAVYLDGELTYEHPGEIRFGAAEGTDAAAIRDIEEFFARADIPHTCERDVQHRLWTKFMLNVGLNQTCAVFGCTYGTVCAPGEEQRAFVAAMREAMAVARAEGVELTEEDMRSMFELTAALAPEGMPSMAQDRLNRRRTEVDEFSGVLIELAERHGILVPTNRFLNEQIREMETGW